MMFVFGHEFDSSSLSLNRCSLPVAVRGSASAKRNSEGRLKGGRSADRCALNFSAVSASPAPLDLRTTKATTQFIPSASALGTTAASCTSAQESSADADGMNCVVA